MRHAKRVTAAYKPEREYSRPQSLQNPPISGVFLWSGLEERKSSCEAFSDDRRSLVDLLGGDKRRGKFYQTSDRSALALRIYAKLISQNGNIPVRNHYKTRQLAAGFVMERVTGIEPALKAWEALILPLNYTRGRNTYTINTSAY